MLKIPGKWIFLLCLFEKFLKKTVDLLSRQIDKYIL
jgi:hypothetical protein